MPLLTLEQEIELSIGLCAARFTAGQLVAEADTPLAKQFADAVVLGALSHQLELMFEHRLTSPQAITQSTLESYRAEPQETVWLVASALDLRRANNETPYSKPKPLDIVEANLYAIARQVLGEKPTSF